MNRETVFSFWNSMKFQPHESYPDFLKRIFSFQKPEFHFGVDKFFPSDSVRSKVDETSTFRNFFGDTVVFNLDDEQKHFIKEHFIAPLYLAAPECLAEQLNEQTLHMTLHDLNASNNCDASFLQKMFDTEILLSEVIRQANIQPQTITMTPTFVFNMVNTSLVLGLLPKTDKDYRNLMYLYSLIESVHSLPYPLTPHITLAYFNHNEFAGDSLYTLQNAVNAVNASIDRQFDICLSTENLYYQKFISMNDYFNIMNFASR
ncbi:MAG: ligT like phosphoesterase [Clostridia bacterium]|nr:ligT like phosphoesterase [Clostridia bacterium]